jgi:hypothetical protein
MADSFTLDAELDAQVADAAARLATHALRGSAAAVLQRLAHHAGVYAEPGRAA